MRFLKIKTNYNSSEELAEFVSYSGLSNIEIEIFCEFENKFKNINFQDLDGKASMFIIIPENRIDELLEIYSKVSLDFKYEDLTKEVFYSKLKYEGDDIYLPVNEFIDNFFENYINVDIILEKISDMGKNSLSERDVSVLDGSFTPSKKIWS